MSPTQQERCEEFLLAAARRADPPPERFHLAFLALWPELERRLRDLHRRLGGAPPPQDDFVMEVGMRLYMAPPTRGERDTAAVGAQGACVPICAWIKTTGARWRNRTRELARREDGELPPENHLPSRLPSPEGAARGAELDRELRAMLGQVYPLGLPIYHLRVDLDLESTELGVALHLTPANIDSRVSRMRLAVRVYLHVANSPASTSAETAKALGLDIENEGARSLVNKVRNYVATRRCGGLP